MESRARIVAQACGNGRTRLQHLAGDGALTVRSTGTGRRARVHLVAGAFGPVGGDVMTLEIAVGAGAALQVAGVAATVVLRSRDPQPSRLGIHIEIADDAYLDLSLPPTVVTAGARHTVDARLHLAAGAGLTLREETIRGRTREAGGEARLVTSVDVAGYPVLRQDLQLRGDVSHPWRPRAVGTLLLVGTRPPVPPEPPVPPVPLPAGAQAAWLRLPRGAGRQLTAIDDDPLALSQLLTAQLPR